MLKPLGLYVLKTGDSDAYMNVVHTMMKYKRLVVTELAKNLLYTVQTGPFKGMQLPERGAWSDLDMGAKLVGAYERELHPMIEDIISREPSFILNVGASEGYYAIGIKRRLPKTPCYTYDIDENSLVALTECMRANDLVVTPLKTFDYNNPLQGIDSDRRRTGFFVFDCEGFEEEIIKFPRSIVETSVFLIELHDHLRPNLTQSLTSFLEPSHDLKIIAQTSHDFDHYPQLETYDLLQRSIILNEQRAVPMNWLYATPAVL